MSAQDNHAEKPRLRPAARPSDEAAAPRPEIRRAEGLRRVFRVEPAPPAAPRPEPRPAPQPTPRQSRRAAPPPSSAAAAPTTLGGVRTTGLQPQGRQIQPQATARRTAQWVAGKLLTIVEVVTIAALVIVVILSLTNLATLNEEAAAEQRLSLTPTAVVQAVARRAVLPGSSQPPPGEEEVPPQFRPYLMPSTPVPLPTPGPRQATRITINKIGVDAPVLEGDDWHTLKKGVGHSPGTANPGEAGNCVLSGHDDVYGEVFRYLSDLEPGDEVVVYTSDGHGCQYVVKTKFLVEPDAVEVMDPTADPVLTLITCYPYLIDTHRLIVVCTLTGDAPAS